MCEHLTHCYQCVNILHTTHLLIRHSSLVQKLVHFENFLVFHPYTKVLNDVASLVNSLLLTQPHIKLWCMDGDKNSHNALVSEIVIFFFPKLSYSLFTHNIQAWSFHKLTWKHNDLFRLQTSILLVHLVPSIMYCHYYVSVVNSPKLLYQIKTIFVWLLLIRICYFVDHQSQYCSLNCWDAKKKILYWFKSKMAIMAEHNLM